MGVHRGFARPRATVLNCANGYQEEDQELVDEIKEGCHSKEDADQEEGDKEAGKEASAETASPKEIGEEDGCSE
jgi:hypothetical protein